MNMALVKEKATEEEKYREARRERFKDETAKSCEFCRHWKEASEVGTTFWENQSRGDVPQWGLCAKKKKVKPVRFGWFTCSNFIQRKSGRRKPARLRGRKNLH